VLGYWIYLDPDPMSTKVNSQDYIIKPLLGNVTTLRARFDLFILEELESTLWTRLFGLGFDITFQSLDIYKFVLNS
jgi:hypothetical protein